MVYLTGITGIMIAGPLKFLRYLFWFLLGLLLILFSVNNRHDAEISLTPLLSDIPAIPVYFILFLGIFIGILITGLSLNWLRLKGFTKRRQAERAATNLESQVSSLSEDLHKNKAALAHSNKGEDLHLDPNQ